MFGGCCAAVGAGFGAGGLRPGVIWGVPRMGFPLSGPPVTVTRLEEEDFIERVPSASWLQAGPRRVPFCPRAAEVTVSPLFLAAHVTTPCGARSSGRRRGRAGCRVCGSQLGRLWAGVWVLNPNPAEKPLACPCLFGVIPVLRYLTRVLDRFKMGGVSGKTRRVQDPPG